MTAAQRTAHTFPTDEVLHELLTAIGSGQPDGPVVMLNLNRYREVPTYADGRDVGSMTGRQAYLHYGVVAKAAIEAGGGRILWAADASGSPLIGCDHDRYDEVVAVWYPSLAKFLALEEYPGYRDALEHRDAAIEQATLLPFIGSPDPELRSPFDV
jgi:uncharacterized protein (DUF1330 family)